MAFSELIQRFSRHVSDVVCLDLASSGIKCVRLHKSGDEIVLQGAALLQLTEPGANGEQAADAPPSPPSLKLPDELRAKHACLTVPGREAVIKLLSFPGHFDEKMEEKVISNMGIKDLANFRISYRITNDGEGRREARILTVAVPEAEAASATGLLETGLPVPHSLEISGLASISAFLHGPGARHASEVVGVVEFGNSISTFAMFNQGNLSLVRRFPFGTGRLVARIQEALGIDEETAAGIIQNGSFDISQTADDLLAPVIKQLVVSRDFIERRENCHLSALYVSGGIVLSHDAVESIRAAMGVDVHTWSPTEDLTVADGIFSGELEGQEWRFASAIGAGLATMEEA